MYKSVGGGSINPWEAPLSLVRFLGDPKDIPTPQSRKAEVTPSETIEESTVIPTRGRPRRGVEQSNSNTEGVPTGPE